VNATALRPAVNLAPIAKRLAGCRYRRRAVAGVAVYSATMKLVIDCVGILGDRVPFDTQIGIDAKRHIVFTSNSATAIASAIRGANDLHHNAAIGAALAPLAGDQTVTIASGAGFCTMLSTEIAGRLATPQAIRAAQRVDPAGAPYRTFAFGTRFAPSGAHAQIVLNHADAKVASADLPIRARVLRTGRSFASDLPYAKLLKLDKATAQGRNDLLDVAQPGAAPLSLYTMWERSDLAFARC
jgi:hypothetical protein